MASYLVGQIKIKNVNLWQLYVAGVAESLTPFDSKIIFRGNRTATIAGENDRDLVVVIEFPNQITLNNWFNSEKYQSLIPIRDQAADVVITTYDAY